MKAQAQHRRAVTLAAALLLAACSAPQRGPTETLPPMPEGASGLQAKPGWAVRRMAVAAANPLASEAGYRVLKAGGNALDAAVAVQMVLALVEPQSSGIGGGAFLMHWDGQRVQAWDGREMAPASADERQFLLPSGKPMPLQQAIAGGLSVGVPGAVRMLEAAHRRGGLLPWAQLFQPAITLAEQGFEISPRLHTQLAAEKALKLDPQAAAYFYQPDGAPHPVGHRLRNPALAATLRAIAARGSAALHEGPVAADMVRRVQGHALNPGRLQLEDLKAYQAREREALCTNWLTHWRVCGMPPPSSGHLAVMQILGLLERQPAEAQPLQDGLPSADWLHRYTEAARLAFADRALYVADPDWVPAPAGRWSSLLDDTYLSQRAALIGPRSMGTAQPGQPIGTRAAWALQPDQPEQGTSHISIVDAQGHAVALTTTIEAVFGSRIMSDGGTGLPGGFLLNNQLTDFSMTPADADGRPVANRVQPGKRPRSSMSPTLVFDRRTGELVMSAGSPGGVAIIHYTAKALIGTLQWGLDAQRAIDLPNFGSFNGPTVLEKGRFPATTLQALKDSGHTVIEADMTSGLQALQRTSSGWFGGADPRREGIVRGE
jgi:gamma-glutamyltranspeptidase / glutathione hydrolase